MHLVTHTEVLLWLRELGLSSDVIADFTCPEGPHHWTPAVPSVQYQYCRRCNRRKLNPCRSTVVLRRHWSTYV